MELIHTKSKDVLVNGAAWRFAGPVKGMPWAMALVRDSGGVEVSVSFGITHPSTAEGLLLIVVAQDGKVVCGDARALRGKYTPLRR